MTTEPLWPPKPKLFEMTGPGSHGRASPITTSIVMSSPSTFVFAVGGIRRFSIDSSAAAASSAPAAPSAWPVTPLIDTTGHVARAEDLGDRRGFGLVVERRRRPVGVDLLDVGRVDAGVGEREAHAGDGADATRRGGGDVVGVGVARAAEDLADDVRTARLGTRPLLEDEHRGAFAHDEAVAIGVERAG